MTMTGSFRHETEKEHISALSLSLNLELIVCAYKHDLCYIYSQKDRIIKIYSTI